MYVLAKLFVLMYEGFEQMLLISIVMKIILNIGSIKV